MGFKVKYEAINKQGFTNAMAKVAATPGLPVKMAYNAGKIDSKIQKELNEGRKLFAGLVEKFAQKDEAGKVIADDNGMFVIPEESKQEFDDQCKSMMEIEFELPYHRLDMHSLERVGLSGKELMALEPVLLTLEVLEGGGQSSPEISSPNVSA